MHSTRHCSAGVSHLSKSSARIKGLLSVEISDINMCRREAIRDVSFPSQVSTAVAAASVPEVTKFIFSCCQQRVVEIRDRSISVIPIVYVNKNSPSTGTYFIRACLFFIVKFPPEIATSRKSPALRLILTTDESFHLPSHSALRAAITPLSRAWSARRRLKPSPRARSLSRVRPLIATARPTRSNLSRRIGESEKCSATT